MQQRGCAPRCVETKGQNPKERSSSRGVVVVGAKERSQPWKRALAARFRGWRVGGAARERSQPLKTSVSGLGCWQQPESRVGGRWRLKKGSNPKRACFRAWDGWGKVGTRWWSPVRGWNLKNEQCKGSFSRLAARKRSEPWKGAFVAHFRDWEAGERLEPQKWAWILVFGVGRWWWRQAKMV